MHLDEQRWEDILQGRPVPPELAAHLEEDCEICETFLSELNAADALDGIVDDALFAVSETKAEAPSDLTYARVERVLGGGGLWRNAAIAGAAVAAIAAAFALVLRGPDQNLKGPTDSPQVSLELLSTNGTALTPLSAGSRVENGATIVFRVSLDRPACIALWSEKEALIDDALCLEKGAHVLEQGGSVVGLPMRTSGPATFSLAPVERGAIPARAPPNAVEVRVVVE